MSMSPTSLKIAAVGSLLALGAGVGVATASAQTTPSPGSTSSTTGGAAAANEGTTADTTAGQGPRGGLGGFPGIRRLRGDGACRDLARHRVAPLEPLPFRSRPFLARDPQEHGVIALHVDLPIASKFQ